ncbi:MAG: ABC transporter permease [Elusimicrobia bacterium]|nr:ABC transporter permease [Elusimicrobiota bacterium]
MTPNSLTPSPNGTPSKFPYIWLAWKIIFFKGNPTIQKFSVATAIAAMGVGVASLLVTIGVIDGFHQEVQKRILGLSPHVFVRLDTDAETRAGEIKAVHEVLGARAGLSLAPFAIGQAMVRTPAATLGVVVKAVDPDAEAKATNLPQSLKRGRWFSSEPSHPVDGVRPAIPLVIGGELAQTLAASPGSRVALIASTGADSLVGLPRILAGEITGVFESGYYEYDSTLAYMPLDRAKELWASQDDVNALFWLGLRSRDPDDAETIAGDLSRQLAARDRVSQVLTWGQMNKSLFAALKLEKLMLTLVLSLIIFVASITVTSNLIMLSAQKTKMVGSLRSLGITQKELARLMLAVGGTLGFLGVLAGLAISCPVIFIILKSGWIRLPPEVYMLEHFPVALDLWDILGVSAFTWVMSLLASALPAYRTARLDPSQILRYG